MTCAFDVQCKWTSKDAQFTTVFCFTNQEECFPTSSVIKAMDFTACFFGTHWWVGLVEEIDNESQDAKVKFLDPMDHINIFPGLQEIMFLVYLAQEYLAQTIGLTR